jgi:hypothetical protein
VIAGLWPAIPPVVQAQCVRGDDYVPGDSARDQIAPLNLQETPDNITGPTREGSLAGGLFVITFHHEAEAQVVMLVPIERFECTAVVPTRPHIA